MEDGNIETWFENKKTRHAPVRLSLTCCPHTHSHTHSLPHAHTHTPWVGSMTNSYRLTPPSPHPSFLQISNTSHCLLGYWYMWLRCRGRWGWGVGGGGNSSHFGLVEFNCGSPGSYSTIVFTTIPRDLTKQKGSCDECASYICLLGAWGLSMQSLGWFGLNRGLVWRPKQAESRPLSHHKNNGVKITIWLWKTHTSNQTKTSALHTSRPMILTEANDLTAFPMFVRSRHCLSCVTLPFLLLQLTSCVLAASHYYALLLAQLSTTSQSPSMVEPPVIKTCYTKRKSAAQFKIKYIVKLYSQHIQFFLYFCVI